ncbi:glycosyltransferase family 4 protein [Xylanibacillus composti]|uniref:Glycosyl transferase family 1 domain-containing protein n=1 Tax=Xylanibacillus composti TaxID=1572762 RepID=A0A8J4M157_9BACL|nr:glycosyltransferase [Xylanibacillus composti]GIQ68520.1 hypothetical protein XYCOK13_13440 [Xylanibacillus composti]
MYRILHAPLDIAGQAGLMCDQLNRLGCFASAYNYYPTYLNYRNRCIVTDAYQLQKMFHRAARAFDIFHFHNGLSFFTDFRDIRWLRESGKTVIMHHRGNDVRFSRQSKQGNKLANPYVWTGSSLPDETIDRNLRFFADYVDLALVQDYELYRYVEDYYKRVVVLPRLIEIDRVPLQLPSANKRIPLVVHAPTDRQFKGSDIIIRTVRELQRKHQFAFVLIERMSHREATRYLHQADIVIDQILCGAYGNVSVEAMAAGKPVIAYIHPELADTYPPGMPVVSANPDTLRAVLAHLLSEPELRRKLGRQGRDYAKAHHDARTVTFQLLSLYGSTMAATKF